MPNDSNDLGIENNIRALRKAFSSLPEEHKQREAARLIRIVEKKPIFIVDMGDASYKAYSIQAVQRVIEDVVGKTPDRSNIYKALKSNSKVFGATITAIHEGDEKWDY